ncbi:hypothetical protein TKWG_01395 [Advenella kashmirensis WT001]|uniref:Uncharacterized protein n=1 Tax=Advenella kashmirensis (strain DSM 17095 / LMG 22695 / WT001) TaxID=1036672 RepID=I3U7G1_ADVKW|nr:hypothetical protein TKWG_01395 [Advenella kashmirensis WT001]
MRRQQGSDRAVRFMQWRIAQRVFGIMRGISGAQQQFVTPPQGISRCSASKSNIWRLGCALPVSMKLKCRAEIFARQARSS